MKDVKKLIEALKVKRDNYFLSFKELNKVNRAYKEKKKNNLFRLWMKHYMTYIFVLIASETGGRIGEISGSKVSTETYLRFINFEYDSVDFLNKKVKLKVIEKDGKKVVVIKGILLEKKRERVITDRFLTPETAKEVEEYMNTILKYSHFFPHFHLQIQRKGLLAPLFPKLRRRGKNGEYRKYKITKATTVHPRKLLKYNKFLDTVHPDTIRRTIDDVANQIGIQKYSIIRCISKKAKY